jgi:hypothetical protein
VTKYSASEHLLTPFSYLTRRCTSPVFCDWKKQLK